jgi:hypothetical protein
MGRVLLIVDDSPNGDGLEITLRGEEAAMFTQILVECSNYNRDPWAASPVHMVLRLLQALDLLDSPGEVEALAQRQHSRPFYGYEQAFSDLRSWMGQHKDPLAAPSEDRSLWDRYRQEKGMKDPSELLRCQATSPGNYICALTAGHEGKHRWVVGQAKAGGAQGLSL